ncbi:siderophore ABC transporter substrate-binding protein [Paenibacillus sp. KN14-4R]|uniref:siderophore ABC transporter substrate-binding protein n=1 Tax=Paenibacillus sp. KN14-4R TaxID=3445773 RepID=UPI003FA12EE8
MKKLFMVLFIALLSVSLVACGSKEASKESTPAGGSSEELTIKHKLGETKIKKNPKKVVVFDYGTLDTLDKLGVEVLGLPKTNLPAYLSKYKDDKYVNAGGLKEPDFEKIHASKPDLIIISGRQSDQYEEFNKIAPTIYQGVDTDKFMESFTENINTIGKIFGKEAEVTKELAQINNVIKTTSDKAKASGKNALILLANDGKISAYGEKSRFGLIHDVMGFKAVDTNIEVSTHGKPVTFEYVAEKNPDYLFVVDRTAAVGGKSAVKDFIENELVKKTNAYKAQHIVYLDSDYWYLSGGGLISVTEMMKQIEAVIK